MNRAELYTSVLSDLNREDKADKLPEWLASASARLNEGLRMEEMVKRAVLDIGLDDRVYPVPADFIEAKSLSVTNRDAGVGVAGSRAGAIRYYPADQLAEGLLVPVGGVHKPEWFTVRGRYVEVGIWNATGDYQLDLWYYAELPVLVADDTTNFLLTKWPHLYREAMLYYGHKHLQEFELAAQYEQSVGSEIALLNQVAERQKYGPGPLIMRRPQRMGGRYS